MSDAPRFPFLVFYGTLVELIHAENEQEARVAFVGLAFAPSPGGRLVPPDENELAVRPLRAADRGWIEDSGAPRAWLRALDEVLA